MAIFSPDFDIARLAIQSIAPNNDVLYDDKGLPSVMVRIPKITYAELGLGNSTDIFPAFIINGVEVDDIYISKYQNVMYNNRVYSLPARNPKVSVNFDNASLYCTNKGAGWHLMSRMEWMLLAHWCLHNNCMPNGNNNYGKDISEDARYHAIPATRETSGTYIGRINHVLTGTGPLTWSHDGTHEGIWDLNGNVSEWQSGMRTVYGELQVLVNNNAADPTHSQAVNSDQWMCISAVDGAYIVPNGLGTTSNALRARWKTSPNNHWEWGIDTASDGTTASMGCVLEYVTCSDDVSDAAKLKLQTLGLFKYITEAGAYKGDYIYMFSAEAERSFCAGGNWYNGVGAGVFFADGEYARSSARTGIGFRSAFVNLPTT